jgi:hypothetical protein
VHSVLYVHPEVSSALVLLRSHELDAHFFAAVRNVLFKLKIARFFNRRISQALEGLGEREGFRAQGDHVENEIDVFRAPGSVYGEFHGLRASNDEVIRGGSQRGQKFENVGPLWFGNHAAFQRGSMALSKR